MLIEDAVLGAGAGAARGAATCGGGAGAAIVCLFEPCPCVCPLVCPRTHLCAVVENREDCRTGDPFRRFRAAATTTLPQRVINTSHTMSRELSKEFANSPSRREIYGMSASIPTRLTRYPH